MTDINGKTVLITGAGGGLGRQMVKQLMQRDCSVIATDVDSTLLKDLAASVSAGPGQISFSKIVDLASPDACRELADDCLERNLVPDILINNAGIAVSGRHTDVPSERWEKIDANQSISAYAADVISA